MSEFVIDEELRSIIPPLRKEERQQLECNILAHGCRIPLVVWNGILLDGHNRYDICTKHDVPYSVEHLDLPDRSAAEEWMYSNQLGRRNLTPDDFRLLLGKLYNRVKRQGARTDLTCPQNADKCSKTSEKLAAEHGVSKWTVERAGKFAEEVERVEREASPELVKAMKDGKVKPSVAIEVAREQPEAQKEIVAKSEAEIISAANAIKRERKQKKKQEREQAIQKKAKEVSPPSERCEILNESLSAALSRPSASVDWVITDPPYPKDYLHLFDTLGEVSAHVLKPGGSLLCMVGQSYLPDVMRHLEKHLAYHWTVSYLTPGGQATQVFPRRVNTFWKPVLWFVKGECGDIQWVGDVTKSQVNDNDKRHHHWGQSESGMLDLMKRFVAPGDVVMDPFMGAGTTGIVALDLGASFVGYDVDKQAYDTSKVRLSDAAMVG